MAAAATGKSIKRECGFCLQVDDDLVDPKQLPCSHVHCRQCLRNAFNQTEVIRCPQCRYNILTSLYPCSVVHIIVM